MLRWDEPADESPDAKRDSVAAYARHAYEQCGHGPLTLYTTSSTMAEKPRTISGYPVVDLGTPAD